MIYVTVQHIENNEGEYHTFETHEEANDYLQDRLARYRIIQYVEDEIVAHMTREDITLAGYDLEAVTQAEYEDIAECMRDRLSGPPFFEHLSAELDLRNIPKRRTDEEQ